LSSSLTNFDSKVSQFRFDSIWLIVCLFHIIISLIYSQKNWGVSVFSLLINIVLVDWFKKGSEQFDSLTRTLIAIDNALNKHFSTTLISHSSILWSICVFITYYSNKWQISSEKIKKANYLLIFKTFICYFYSSTNHNILMLYFTHTLSLSYSIL